MITVAFLMLVAFTALEMHLVVLAVTGFLDLVILAVINNVVADGSGEELTEWE